MDDIYPIRRAIVMDRDMWSAALTAVGVIAGALVTLILGMIKAKRAGLDSISIAEIADRAAFRSALLKRLAYAESRADAAVDRADKAEERADAAELRARKLQGRVEELEARMTHQENNGNG